MAYAYDIVGEIPTATHELNGSQMVLQQPYDLKPTLSIIYDGTGKL